MDQNISSVANTYEPPPVENDNRPVWEIVQEDYKKLHSHSFYMNEIIELMRERDAFGRKKHGVPLQSFNGRNPLRDSIQEKCDFVVYIRQAIEEGYDLDNMLQDLYEQSLRDLEVIYLILGNTKLKEEKEAM